MIGTIAGWACVAVGALVGLGWLLSLAVKWFPATVPASVARIGDVISDVADVAAADALLLPLVALGWKQGDTEFLALLGQARTKVKSWLAPKPPAG